jgi:hypothetical protein
VPAANVQVVFDYATRTATLTFPGYVNGVLPNGDYRATFLAASATDAGGNPMAADFAADFWVLAGDVNRDRRVDGSDFAILAGNFGKTGMTYAQGNLNGQGSVNGSDFALLAANFGRSLSAPPPAAPAASYVARPAKSIVRRPPPRRDARVATRLSK